MTDPHVFIDLSHRDRVFIVGDIHGEFGVLDEELDKVQFDPNKDALISVGDITDRGPDSMYALEWIKKPWFIRVRGNHCEAPTLFLTGQISYLDAEKWGGQWFLNFKKPRLREVAEQLTNAPYALTIKTPAGHRIGVTHADCLKNWNDQISHMAEDSWCKAWVRELSIWGRETIKALMKSHKRGDPFDTESARVTGIDHVFHGHTVQDEPLTVANRTWIDTGACFGYDLTLLNIDDFLRDKLVE